MAESFILGVAVSLQVSALQQLYVEGILFTAFVSAALFEEFVKLVALRLTLFRNPDFTQPSDGVTYAVFLSLGFATAENIVLVQTMEMGIIRAFTSTPAHALFAVTMGYYLGKYRFNRGDKMLLFLALVVPTMLHGVYNFLIMSGQQWGLFLFVPYVVFLWVLGMFKLSKLNKKVREIANLDKE